MPFKKGQPRPQGAGRVKGTPNKGITVRDILDRHEIEPIEELIGIYHESEDSEQRERIMSTLARFVYVQPKQVQHDGSIQHIGGIQVQLVLPDNGRKAIPIEAQAPKLPK